MQSRQSEMFHFASIPPSVAPMLPCVFVSVFYTVLFLKSHGDILSSRTLLIYT